MPDTKLRAVKATNLLKDDHQKVKKLLKEFERSKETVDKINLFGEIRRELSIHAQIEEEIFYPALAEGGDAEAEERVATALKDHALMKTMLKELAAIGVGDEAFDIKMEVLSENVQNHAEDEEKNLFPLFQKCSREEREGISERLAIRRRELDQAVQE